MAKAPDWSTLHKDLLLLISSRLDNEADIIRFRSVCSTWRSFLPNHSLPFKLPHFHTSSLSCYLSKHNIFLIKPPQQEQQQTLRPWLIRIAKNSCGESQLFHPLLSLDSSSPYHFPHVLDLKKFSVVRLGADVVMGRYNEEPTILGRSKELSQFELHLLKLQRQDPTPLGYGMGKKVVAIMQHGKNKKTVALGTLNQNGHPLLFHCSEERWTLIPCMSTYFLDICVFKERFYAVNKIGRAVAFGLDYSVELVAEHVNGGDMKFLVESKGELLLVDICDSHCFGFPGEKGLKLKVFRLNEKKKEWKSKSLGDRVLFLGNGCSFSASASDLSVAKGNCVVFIDDAFIPFDNMRCGMCVFDLDEHRLSPLSHYPDYFNLFWPPPEWILEMQYHS